MNIYDALMKKMEAQNNLERSLEKKAKAVTPSKSDAPKKTAQPKGKAKK